PVGVVVEGHPGPVQAGGGTGEHGGAPPGPAGGDGTREGVARDRQGRRQPDELGEVACGGHAEAPSCSHHRVSARHCPARVWSRLPSGSLKKKASGPSTPFSPRSCARAVSRTRSMTSGAASAESQPSQVNCIVIRVPRKPSKWTLSQAVFQSPKSST